MEYDIDKIKQSLRRKLDNYRYEHTIGVAYTATSLAMRYGEDIKKAEVAGLLHDCAKCIPDDKKLAKCIKHKINITDIEKERPYLLHSKLGAFYAMKKYDVYDKDIINSILNHTTGCPNMTLLEKIVFAADYIEPGINKAKNLDEIRKIAFEDLDMAVYIILRDTLDYLSKKTGNIDDMTQKAYEYYSNLITNRDDNCKQKDDSCNKDDSCEKEDSCNKDDSCKKESSCNIDDSCNKNNSCNIESKE